MSVRRFHRFTSRRPTRLMLATPLLGLILAAAPAPSHLHLVTSTPAANATLDQSPKQIRLVFSARVTLASIDLRDANGKRAALGKVKLTVSPRETGGQGKDSVVRNAGIVTAAVPEPLKPGRYELKWKAAGSDGHAIRKQFAFTIGRAAPPSR